MEIPSPHYIPNNESSKINHNKSFCCYKVKRMKNKCRWSRIEWFICLFYLNQHNISHRKTVISRTHKKTVTTLSTRGFLIRPCSNHQTPQQMKHLSSRTDVKSGPLKKYYIHQYHEILQRQPLNTKQIVLP
jgi:hypothetical protein